jgi:hypothetical protein
LCGWRVEAQPPPPAAEDTRWSCLPWLDVTLKHAWQLPGGDGAGRARRARNNLNYWTACCTTRLHGTTSHNRNSGRLVSRAPSASIQHNTAILCSLPPAPCHLSQVCLAAPSPRFPLRLPLLTPTDAIWAASPTTTRGQPTPLSSDPKGERIAYAVGLPCSHLHVIFTPTNEHVKLDDTTNPQNLCYSISRRNATESELTRPPPVGQVRLPALHRRPRRQ